MKITGKNRAEITERIVAAAARPLFQIVEVREVLFSDGKWRAGDPPAGVRSTDASRVAGYCFVLPEGIRIGTRYPTREDAERSQIGMHKAEAEEFRRQLDAMTVERLSQQAAYWLKTEMT